MFSPRTGLPDDKTKLSVIAVGIEIIAKKKYKTAINVPLGCFLINATTNTVIANTKYKPTSTIKAIMFGVQLNVIKSFNKELKPVTYESRL